MQILTIALWAILLLIAWYEARWIFCIPPMHRPAFFTFGFQANLATLKFVLAAASLGLTWWQFGVLSFVIAFIAGLMFQRWLFRHYEVRGIVDEMARIKESLLNHGDQAESLIPQGMKGTFFAYHMARMRVNAAFRGHEPTPEEIAAVYRLGPADVAPPGVVSSRDG